MIAKATTSLIPLLDVIFLQVCFLLSEKSGSLYVVAKLFPIKKIKRDTFLFNLWVWDAMLGVTPADQALALSGVTDR